MTLELSVPKTTHLRDVEPWMFDIARKRPGKYTVRILLPIAEFLLETGRARHRLTGFHKPPDQEVRITFTGEEWAKLDKVICNQTYAESKSKIMSTITFQHACTIWPTYSEDDVTMRTLGPWAVVQYRCNGTWSTRRATLALLCWRIPLPICCGTEDYKMVRLELKHGKRDGAPGGESSGPKSILPEGTDASKPADESGQSQEGQPQDTTPSAPPAEEPEDSEEPARNALGFTEIGEGNKDKHPLGSVDDDDAMIRALRDDRILRKDAGIGVIGQSMNPENPKQIVGVVSLPVSYAPNVYAKEADNIECAIKNRITMKQLPFTATKEDKRLIGRVVNAAMGDNPRLALFSARRITTWWEKHVFYELRSGKWTEKRMNDTVVGLCTRIDPSFKLKCDIKLEAMVEGKPPRMLIADGDEGQVLALLTICCMEDLIKQHLPKKTIKGMAKRPAMERVAAELRVPKSAYNRTKGKASSKPPFAPYLPEASVFEGDGKAWDTCCSASLRGCTENPILVHIASVLKAHMIYPASWVDAHTSVCGLEKLAMAFKKNKQFRKFIIDAIRRSGHRGTSCLNWWDNKVVWNAAIFEQPEMFLDPDVRYGKDHAGIFRWLAEAYEGDDSISSTTPKIEEGTEIYVAITQMWTRLGFNMEIFLRTDRALFTGYYMALDANGPTGVMMPEIGRCLGRSGVSCSATMIEYFNNDDKVGCMSISKAASLARAYEFAGLSPTISTKYLRFYDSLPGKTEVDHDLIMRTCGGDAEFREGDIVAQIINQNGAALDFDTSEIKRLEMVGFKCTEEELSQFSLRMWDYDLLYDWEGFRASLPQTWRS